MSGWSILIAGLVLGNVVYLVLTLVAARIFGLRPPLAMLGLLWRPVTFRLGSTVFHVGPLPVTASVAIDVMGSGHDGRGPEASPLAHAVMAVFAFAVLLLLGLAVAGQTMIAAVVAALKAYVTLPFHIGTPMNLASTLEGMAAQGGPVSTVAIVMAVMAAVNLIPLPPFAGFTFVSDLFHALRGRPVPYGLLRGLLKLNVVWLMVLAVTLVVRHLGG